MHNNRFYRKYGKRWLDLAIAIPAFILSLPAILILSFILAILNKGKFLFKQLRPGLHDHPFFIYKFKTMTDKTDEHGHLLSDEERLTGFGKFVRKTSLDELPQLWNVLKGDISLIGPRPLLIDYLPLYSPEQAKRHMVKPGITGWAQVNGRNAIDWQQKFKYDVWYVENVSFKLDLKILWMTFVKVLKAEGISQAGKATTEPFRGNKEQVYDRK